MIRFGRAGERCEHCGAANLQPHPITGSKVIPTVAHLNQDRADDRAANLRALYQRCHFAHDREENARKRRGGRRRGLTP